jgi:hypothetical protein
MFAWRRTATGKRVFLSLKTGKGLRGVLWAKRGPLLILKGVTLHEGGRDPVTIPNEVVVERENVDFFSVEDA